MRLGIVPCPLSHDCYRSPLLFFVLWLWKSSRFQSLGVRCDSLTRSIRNLSRWTCHSNHNWGNSIKCSVPPKIWCYARNLNNECERPNLWGAHLDWRHVVHPNGWMLRLLQWISIKPSNPFFNQWPLAGGTPTTLFFEWTQTLNYYMDNKQTPYAEI